MNDDIRNDENPQQDQPIEQPASTPPPPPQQGGYFAPPPGQQAYYTPPPPNQPRRRSWVWPAAFAVGCLPWLILILLGIVAIIGGTSTGGGGGIWGDDIALISIRGVITAGESTSGLFSGGSAGSEDIVAQLERARKSGRVKAVVLRIDSPGGSPSGSEEVYNEIMRVRKKKPVYCSMGDVAASGGYYIASACTKIFADSSTLTGSIGVIWDITDMSALYKKVGFNTQVIKSGKFKDIGSSNRPLTADERKLLQDIVMDTYTTFVQAVSIGRNIPEPQVRKLADGRVYTGKQALKVRLIDEIGGLHDTVKAAAIAGGISGEPGIVEYKQQGFFDSFLGSSEEKFNSNEAEAYKKIAAELLKAQQQPSGLK